MCVCVMYASESQRQGGRASLGSIALVSPVSICLSASVLFASGVERTLGSKFMEHGQGKNFPLGSTGTAHTFVK